MRNKLALIIVIAIISIALVMGYILTKDNNESTVTSKHTVDVMVIQATGTSEDQGGRLKENEGIEILEFLIKNNGSEDYEFDPGSIYLDTKHGKIFCSEIAPPEVILLPKTIIKAKSEQRGVLTFKVSLYSFDYDICFDDGHEKYVISSQEDRDKDMENIQTND